jgi:hypothetical protein
MVKTLFAAVVAVILLFSIPSMANGRVTIAVAGMAAVSTAVAGMVAIMAGMAATVVGTPAMAAGVAVVVTGMALCGFLMSTRFPLRLLRCMGALLPGVVTLRGLPLRSRDICRPRARPGSRRHAFTSWRPASLLSRPAPCPAFCRSLLRRIGFLCKAAYQGGH